MRDGVRSVHFVGICGTAMAGTAAAMRQRGFEVTGSDEGVYPPMSSYLEEQGIPVMTGYAEGNLAHRPDLVVIGNAISRGNPEAEFALEHKLAYCSLPELLKHHFIRGKRSVVVAGTHGKTSTAALLTWVFEHAGLQPSYLVGGIPNNLKQGARFTDSDWFIVEGDEYDTAFFDKRSKFIHYLPEVLLLNNLEFDHADIFEDLAAIQKSFRHLIRLVPRTGLVLANGDDPNLAPLLDVDFCPVQRFGLSAANMVQATRLELGPTSLSLEVAGTAFRVGLTGELNARNALAVICAARHCGLTDTQIQSAFDAFTGIKRRMEIRGVAGDVTVIDDFGHHPTAIRETLRALRLRYPTRRLWAVFEPRSNTTRRKVFQHELVRAFADADAAVVARVARLELLPEAERLDPVRLIADLESTGKAATYLPDADSIVAHVAGNAQAGDVVCVFSNGGFGGIHEKLLQALDRR